MLEINTLYHRMMRTAKMPGQMSIAAAEADYIRGLERRLQEAKRLSEAAPPFQRR